MDRPKGHGGCRTRYAMIRTALASRGSDGAGVGRLTGP
jgi:hypothetical protein